MRRYEGRLKIELIISIKMAVSLCVIMLSLVAADSTTETSPESPVTTTTLLPHSEDGDVPVNVTARVGSEIIFDCWTSGSKGDIVIWEYMNPRTGILSIHTANNMFRSTHAALSFQAPNNYRLKISSVDREDEGLYKCLLLLSRKQFNHVFLKVTGYEDSTMDGFKGLMEVVPITYNVE